MRTTNLTVTVGKCLFDEATKVARWTIGNLYKDKTPQLNGTVLFQNTNDNSSSNSSNVTLKESPPIQMLWKVPMASVSGLSVAALQLTNESYKPYKGVRTLTQSGNFQIRS